MQKFVRTLYDDMRASLEEIESSASNTLEWAERSYQAVDAVLQQLKEYIVDYSFKNKAEEILFFKELKPKFQKELIFFIEVYYTELNRPVAGQEHLEQYYTKVLEGIQSFFQRNQMLYGYYRTAKSSHDELFFVRDSINEPFLALPEYSLDMDPRFTTLNSSRFAKIQAYELLRDHVQRSIDALKQPQSSIDTVSNRQHLWTDSKAALIELAYAMYARGSVNNGRVDVKTIVSALEHVFNVQVGNFYRAFQNMRIRKKNRTTYLDALKESLERKMDETDLNFL